MADNGCVFAPSVRRKWLYVVIALTITLTSSGCGHTSPPHLLSNDPGNASVAPADPDDNLAALVAALQDKRYVAAYTLHTDGRADRSVLVSIATDNSWRVDVPGGALGGGANVAIVSEKTGVYQCLLGGPATNVAPPAPPKIAPSMSPSPTASPPPFYASPACVKAAAAGHNVPSEADPIIEHIFTNWLDVMTDRNAPISVFQAAALPNSTGTCYSIEPSSASIAPPMSAGIFCFLADGTMTAAAIAHYRLTLAGPLGSAPATNPLPGGIIDGPLAPTAAHP